MVSHHQSQRNFKSSPLLLSSKLIKNITVELYESNECWLSIWWGRTDMIELTRLNSLKKVTLKKNAEICEDGCWHWQLPASGEYGHHGVVAVVHVVVASNRAPDNVTLPHHPMGAATAVVPLLTLKPVIWKPALRPMVRNNLLYRSNENRLCIYSLVGGFSCLVLSSTWNWLIEFRQLMAIMYLKKYFFRIISSSQISYFWNDTFSHLHFTMSPSFSIFIEYVIYWMI